MTGVLTFPARQLRARDGRVRDDQAGIRGEVHLLRTIRSYTEILERVRRAHEQIAQPVAADVGTEHSVPHEQVVAFSFDLEDQLEVEAAAHLNDSATRLAGRLEADHDVTPPIPVRVGAQADDVCFDVGRQVQLQPNGPSAAFAPHRTNVPCYRVACLTRVACETLPTYQLSAIQENAVRFDGYRPTTRGQAKENYSKNRNYSLD